MNGENNMHKLIIKQFKKYKIEYTIFFVFYITNVIFALFEPVIFGKILDSIINNVGKIDFETSKNILFLVCILIVQYITNYIYRRILFGLFCWFALFGYLFGRNKKMNAK